MTEQEVLQSFRRNEDGSWQALRSVQISAGGVGMTIGPGMSFSRGIQFMGVDLAAYLDSLAAKYGVPR